MGRTDSHLLNNGITKKTSLEFNWLKALRKGKEAVELESTHHLIVFLFLMFKYFHSFFFVILFAAAER